jgi:hypothetical protein
MSVVVCEQLGLVMGDQAISIAEAKTEPSEARTRWKKSVIFIDKSLNQ